MTPIDFFRLQAKNLFKDYKTKVSVLDKETNNYYYEYSPQYFDVMGIILHYDIDEENFSLMNAQHLIANIAGFEKWTDMLKASEAELELGKLLFDNQHKISSEEWQDFILRTESDNQTFLDDEFKVQIFQEVFSSVEGHKSLFQDFRLNKGKNN